MLLLGRRAVLHVLLAVVCSALLAIEGVIPVCYAADGHVSLETVSALCCADGVESGSTSTPGTGGSFPGWPVCGESGQCSDESLIRDRIPLPSHEQTVEPPSLLGSASHLTVDVPRSPPRIVGLRRAPELVLLGSVVLRT